MKTTLKLLLVAALVFTGMSASAQELKLGYTNPDEILMIMPEMAEIQKNLQTLQEELNKQMTALQNEYTTRIQDYNKKVTTYSETVRAQVEKELEDLRTRLMEFETNAQEQFSAKRDELFQPVVAKFQKALEEISQEGKFTYIFAQPQLLYINKSLAIDVTPLVKTKLGI